MSEFLKRFKEMTEKRDREEYVDSLIGRLSASEEGEWLAYELSRLHLTYMRELADCREEDLKRVQGRIDMLRDLFVRLRMAAQMAEGRRAERIDRGSRRWTPVITEDPGLL